jgi:hypothetical protein
VLPPTTETLLEPERVPYFAWDLGKTGREIREILGSGEQGERDEIVIRLLREANSRDVWLFIGWDDIEQARPGIAHRLGRARAVWELMRRRRERTRGCQNDHGPRQAG